MARQNICLEFKQHTIEKRRHNEVQVLMRPLEKLLKEEDKYLLDEIQRFMDKVVDEHDTLMSYIINQKTKQDEMKLLY